MYKITYFSEHSAHDSLFVLVNRWLDDEISALHVQVDIL